MLFVGIEKFRPPEFLIAEKIYLAGAPAGEGEPLDIIGFADVIEGGVIERRMCRRDRHDSGKVLRRFFCSRPLIEPGLGAAPHRDFAVAKWLLREPLHHVVAVVWLLGERFELTPGISATTNIDKRKPVTVGSEICGSRVIRIGDVRCESENDGCARDCSIFCSWEIKRCVQFDLIAHRNFYAPAKIVVR